MDGVKCCTRTYTYLLPLNHRLKMSKILYGSMHIFHTHKKQSRKQKQQKLSMYIAESVKAVECVARVNFWLLGMGSWNCWFWGGFRPYPQYSGARSDSVLRREPGGTQGTICGSGFWSRVMATTAACKASYLPPVLSPQLRSGIT